MTLETILKENNIRPVEVSESESFANWMANTIHSVHYADNRAMFAAYCRVEQPYNELPLYFVKWK